MFVAGVILFVVGCLLIPGAIFLARRPRAQASWPQVPGVITRSQVIHGEDIVADIEYQYVHRGRTWTGTTVMSNQISGSWPARSRKLVDKYPVGATVKVYVDPGNPMGAVLEPGGDGCFLPFAAGFIAFVLLIGVLLMRDH